MSELREDTIGELFKNLMQHLKCIEIRLEYAAASTSQKQKYAINNAVNKVRVAINHICDLLGDSSQVLKIKSDLDKADLVYVMVLTEQLLGLSSQQLDEVTDIIDKYLINKYGSESEHQQM